MPIYGCDSLFHVMTRAVNIVYSSSHDYTLPIYGNDILWRIHVPYMTLAVTLTLCTYTVT